MVHQVLFMALIKILIKQTLSFYEPEEYVINSYRHDPKQLTSPDINSFDTYPFTKSSNSFLEPAKRKPIFLRILVYLLW